MFAACNFKSFPRQLPNVDIATLNFISGLEGKPEKKLPEDAEPF